jgi:DNA invertase Pin-like site-specific DNA recombinase
MPADAKAGKFQQVLVRNLSRLSRRNSLKTAAQIVGPLRATG